MSLENNTQECRNLLVAIRDGLSQIMDVFKICLPPLGRTSASEALYYTVSFHMEDAIEAFDYLLDAYDYDLSGDVPEAPDEAKEDDDDVIYVSYQPGEKLMNQCNARLHKASGSLDTTGEPN